MGFDQRFGSYMPCLLKTFVFIYLLLIQTDLRNTIVEYMNGYVFRVEKICMNGTDFLADKNI